MAHVARLSRDPTEAAGLARRGLELVLARHTWRRNAERTYAVLERATAAQQGHRLEPLASQACRSADTVCMREEPAACSHADGVCTPVNSVDTEPKELARSVVDARALSAADPELSPERLNARSEATCPK
jgi:hypothetical protein